MDHSSIDRIIAGIEDLPNAVPNLHPEFLNESRMYWQALKDVFFGDGYHQSLASNVDFASYEGWYSTAIIPFMNEVQRSHDKTLKRTIRGVFRHYQKIDAHIVTVLPLQYNHGYQLVLPNNDNVNIHEPTTYLRSH